LVEGGAALVEHAATPRAAALRVCFSKRQHLGSHQFSFHIVKLHFMNWPSGPLQT
jgi:hypothetical protein